MEAEPAALTPALRPIAGTWGSGQGSKRETGGDLRVGGQRGGERQEGDQRCRGGARLGGDSTGTVRWPASRALLLVSASSLLWQVLQHEGRS